MIIRADSRAALAALAALNPARIRSHLQGAVQSTLQDAKNLATKKLNARYTRPDFATNKMQLKTSGLHGSLSVTDHRYGLTQYVVNPNTRPIIPPEGSALKFAALIMKFAQSLYRSRTSL